MRRARRVFDVARLFPTHTPAAHELKIIQSPCGRSFSARAARDHLSIPGYRNAPAPKPHHITVSHFSTTPDEQEQPLTWRDRLRLPVGLKSLAERGSLAYTRLIHVSTKTKDAYNYVSQTKWGRLARWNAPAGAHLLFLPGAWGVALGAGSVGEVVGLSALLYTGAILARGGGCTVNDVLDADVDRQVERTRTRPVASGEVSVTGAALFAAAQFGGGLCVLVALPPSAFMLGSCALIPVLYYPIAKRVVAWPQAVLAGTFSLSALVGYTSGAGALALPALPLYAAAGCWTMVYDTVYARQDARDDAKLGVRSTALVFSRKELGAFAAAHAAFLFAAGASAGLGLPFYMGASVAAARVLAQALDTDLDDRDACARSFAHTPATGAIVWASILAGRVI